jgi:ribosomal-protein-alanine N-acetyltransferase
MTGFVVELFGVQILYGRVMKGNEASVKVLEKCRYRFLREDFGAEDDPYGRGMLVYGKG